MVVGGNATAAALISPKRLTVDGESDLAMEVPRQSIMVVVALLPLQKNPGVTWQYD